MRTSRTIGGLLALSFAVCLLGAEVIAESGGPQKKGGRAAAPRITAQAKQVEVSVTDDAIVRIKSAPLQFDERGRPRKTTAEELKQLKGDSKLWGYGSDYGDIRAGQIVQLFLAKVDTMPKEESEKPKKSLAKQAKPNYQAVAQVAGRVVRTDSVRPNMMEKVKKNEGKRPPPAASLRKLTVVMDVPTIAGQGGKGQGKGQVATMGADLAAYMIYIMEDPPKVQEYPKEKPDGDKP